ncbi:TrkH family potassium uptake protein [Salinicola sp. DM10]|uniref:TrkH family potassium uptake protein n=1 Tax=Salinicola sp. DM10 TaxID=2815721 RepID=UPI001A8FFAF0|nr:TrkH family potassium uptake protein [Salinicola sp. DM10]MCE3027585.1 TrkH family potassium uptake protein [Salinicola sp. DM10]
MGRGGEVKCASKGRETLQDAKPILKVLALLLIVLAVFMLPPIVLLKLEGDPDLWAFLKSMALVAATSAGLLAWTWHTPVELKTQHMFILTTSSWVVISAFASLPLVLGAPQLSFTDAVFESISAITTTGSTVLSGIEHLSDGLKLWRGLMQWLGGIGIIVMAIAILPFLKVGGMRLFQTESSDWSDKVLPRAGGIAKASAVIYLGLTLVAILSYRLAGMQTLDAIVHAMSSVSTGGFANYDASFGIYESRPLILWLGCAFMLAGALPFVLYIRLIRDSRGALWQDQQVRGLLTLLVVVIGTLTLYRVLAFHDAPFSALTEVAFNVISVVTTTGYASQDYSLWGPLAVTTFFFITFVGGCSGSTSGGMKIFRFQIGGLMLLNQLRYLVHPSGVFAQRYNGRPLNDEVVRAVIAFSFFFFLIFAVLSLALAALGLDMVTATTGAATALANVGPGLGPIIGPAGNFASLPDAAKWILCIGMLMGRLEILTVLVLLMPFFWRK